MKRMTLVVIAALTLATANAGRAGTLKNETFDSLPDSLTNGWNGWSAYATATATMGGVTDFGGHSGRSLKMTDAATGAPTGQDWKPQLEYRVSGSDMVTTAFQVDFDFCLTGASSLTDAQAIQLYVSSKGGTPTGAIATVQIGGASGIKANSTSANKSVAFGQWGHATINVDAPGTGATGVISVTVTQGSNVVSVNNVAFSKTTLTSIDDFAFQLGGGAIAGDGVAAYFDNIVIQTVPEPASLGLLGFAGCIWLGRRSK